ncbi:Methionyl-tRNA formyltransferase [Commensalibacter sp. Nvir]|uniref:methionyl-tRNA formyltransferase n=1 Tax=Commensalibacter sp. Nvir TaxID=3069817 RepID=UPI002D60CED7|nr:Methionyl-tRNA formyltransferase [Commensalibacter sp. Nvir]
MRIIFMGTPEFSVPALTCLHRTENEIVAVYCQPPRPKGRGKKLTPCAVQQTAEQLNLPVFTPITLKHNEQEFNKFKSFNADIAVIAAYGLILPPQILTLPKHGCVNIHASLLPRWRGAAPIQNAIRSGDKQSGITIMKMEEGLDTGPVYLAKPINIYSTTDYISLHDDLALLGSQLIVQFINSLNSGIRLFPKPQSHDGITYAKQLSKIDGKIDWNLTAEQIARQIKAFVVWPGSFTYYQNQLLKIIKAEPFNLNTNFEPGTIIDPSFIVSCGQNQAIKILEIQPAGKRSMTVENYLRGNILHVGTRLGICE